MIEDEDKGRAMTMTVRRCREEGRMSCLCLRTRRSLDCHHDHLISQGHHTCLPQCCWREFTGHGCKVHPDVTRVVCPVQL
jgi:hypothetical protein